MKTKRDNSGILAKREALQRVTRNFWHGKGNATAAPKRATTPIDVLDIDGIVKLSGYTKNSVYTVSRAEGFPLPITRIGRRLFWARDDIEAWLKN
jgi:predicted DNA-binding transcriptional regulator AlpA